MFCNGVFKMFMLFLLYFYNMYWLFCNCFTSVEMQKTSSSLKSELATGFLDGRDVFLTWTDLDFGVDEKRS